MAFQYPPTELPTLQSLGVTSAPAATDIDASAVSEKWLASLSKALDARDAAGAASLFVPGAYWRDLLAFTWDIRTFRGPDKIKTFLADTLAQAKPTKIALTPGTAAAQAPFPDVLWVIALFSLETSAGPTTGVLRLVPTQDGSWKAHGVLTSLEGLAGNPERIGPFRENSEQPPHHPQPTLESAQPTVVIVGGGHSGLNVAARLKALGVNSLILEKNSRVGDNWRGRYESLVLHDPVWYDHLPYLPFPPTWPVHTRAPKLGDWLESYATSLDLDVLTSTPVVRATHDEKTGSWTVVARRSSDGKERTFNVKHVVLAVGLGEGWSKIPEYKGLDTFGGKALHSYSHKSADEYKGKKVLVVGACTAAHDIAAECVRKGVDVTMYQRSPTYVITVKTVKEAFMKGLYEEGGPPTEIADLLGASFPYPMQGELGARSVLHFADLDKDTLEGLAKVGFRTNKGFMDKGIFWSLIEAGGGYYIDTGACKHVIDGSIKLKSGPPAKPLQGGSSVKLTHFTRDAAVFDDGSEVKADVVIFATGLGTVKDAVHQICDPKTAEKVKKIWALDSEGEINGVYRDGDVPGLYIMMGNLAICRLYSKYVAMQIAAKETGAYGTPYRVGKE
ncbi:FAD/NAD(P)-binding domain-containing protein [Schizophyllum commune H4-8]|uniref:FAD/NAD(P)-binding domain-containing protein n=1 Tax=Schizophyllum commune (strain H4-8 / FGSC 9210) TaxID=578458 RepID=D8Q5B8_SCHCM|nr:FAD/NAD(P)-binding domain-containing protein [Schizophyllum commune H4-8]KAI5892249.1 FAD/NAD(P)-binding domain-containing protein [Schizophyllum commune H4-8]